MDTVTHAPRCSARAFLPREHGLWCWVGAPMLGAVLVAPSLGGLLAVLSVFALFAAGNAARAQAWGAAGAALTGSAVFGLAALPFLAAPGLWLTVLASIVVSGALLLDTLGRKVGRAVERHTRYELAAIAGFALVGAGIAGAAGAPLEKACAVALTLIAWQVTGLWWVRGQLARVLPGREPWSAGRPTVAALTVGTAATVVLLGAPLLAPIPALYAARARFTRPPTSGRDARRIGLTEAGWAAVATTLAALGAL